MRPVYAVETLALCWDEGQELLQEHWREIALNRDQIVLAPDLASYQDMERRGQLLLVTMRVEGKLVGYHASLIRPHLHYRHSLTAFTDVFYVKPEHRLGRNAMHLFEHVEYQLKNRGVERMYASCKLSLDLLPLFTRVLGWTEIERVFSKMVA